MPSSTDDLTGEELGTKLLQSVREMKVGQVARTTAIGETSSITRARGVIQEGLDDVTAGRLVPMKNARAWADSLGTENELPVPRT
jgi:hypothetical protein